MGYIKHHAIVVVGTYVHEKYIEPAHAFARTLFPWVSDICPEQINGTRSFFIPPDGSKEYWHESQQGDERRNEFIEHLKTYRYEDGSSPLKWAEVVVHDEAGPADVSRSTREPELA